MITNKYKLVFYGQIFDGLKIAVVKNNLKVLLKSDNAGIDRLFSVSSTILKNNLDEAVAAKFKAAFENTGAKCVIEPVDNKAQSPLSPEHDTDSEVSAETMKCPKCFLEQAISPACIACGIVFVKYQTQQEKANSLRVSEETAVDETYPVSLGIIPNSSMSQMLAANVKYILILLLVIGATSYWLGRSWISTCGIMLRAGHAVKSTIYSTWIKSYNRRNLVTAIYPTKDGGFIAAGWARTQLDNGGWLIKLDAGGNIQWQQGYGRKGTEKFHAVIQTSDDGYLAVGETRTSEKASVYEGVQGVVVKLDPQGVVQWRKTSTGVVFKSLSRGPDNDVLVSGETYLTSGIPVTAIIAARLNSDGNIKWQQTFSSEAGRAIKATSDGGCIVLGGSEDVNFSESTVAKIGANGELQWFQEYKARFNSVEETAAGEFLLAGFKSVAVGGDSFTGTGYDGIVNRRLPKGPDYISNRALLVRIDHNGIIQWQKQYGGGISDDSFKVMRRTLDGQLIILGDTMTYGAGHIDIWMLKLDLGGNIKWQKTLGGPQKDFANDLQLTPDDGFVVVGTTLSLGDDAERTLFAKVDSSGNVPSCSLLAIHSSNSGVDDVSSLPVKNDVPLIGPFVPLVLESSTAQSIQTHIRAVSYYPPEPRLDFIDPEIKFLPFGRNEFRIATMRIENSGISRLTFRKVMITQRYDSQSSLSILMAMNPFQTASTFSISHSCNSVEPGKQCDLTIKYRIGSSGESKAALTIISNDPVTPVITIPINAIATGSEQ